MQSILYLLVDRANDDLFIKIQNVGFSNGKHKFPRSTRCNDNIFMSPLKYKAKEFICFDAQISRTTLPIFIQTGPMDLAKSVRTQSSPKKRASGFDWNGNWILVLSVSSGTKKWTPVIAHNTIATEKRVPYLKKIKKKSKLFEN